MQIIHVTGTLDWPDIEPCCASLGKDYHACAYLHHEMGLAQAAADLALSRAGASTLAEFPYFGLPSILVPYPYAWRYQKVNADYLADRGAALRLDDERMEQDLLPAIRGLFSDAVASGRHARSSAVAGPARWGPASGSSPGAARGGNRMIELSAVLVMMTIFFGIIGFLRGWSKELISMAGIILGLFALFQFDNLLRGTLLRGVALDQVFFIQTGIFVAIVFFAYQTRALGRGNREGRSSFQESALGALVGLVNGYLIWGSHLVFHGHQQLSPGSVRSLPPRPVRRAIRPCNGCRWWLLGGGVDGNGDLLAVAVIVLFLFVRSDLVI